jgi:hypothetical protein
MKISDDSAEVFRALIKYEYLKKCGAKNPPKEVIDIHIEVARFILEKERCIPDLDDLVKKTLSRLP